MRQIEEVVSDTEGICSINVYQHFIAGYLDRTLAPNLFYKYINNTFGEACHVKFKKILWNLRFQYESNIFGWCVISMCDDFRQQTEIK